MSPSLQSSPLQMLSSKGLDQSLLMAKPSIHLPMCLCPPLQHEDTAQPIEDRRWSENPGLRFLMTPTNGFPGQKWALTPPALSFLIIKALTSWCWTSGLRKRNWLSKRKALNMTKLKLGWGLHHKCVLGNATENSNHNQCPDAIYSWNIELP